MTKLKEYCLKATKIGSIYIGYAARIKIDQLHSIIYPIDTKLFNETERTRVQVLVLGAKAPRKGFVIQQYFETLIGDEKLEGKRRYAENMVNEKLAMNVLGSWILDAHAVQVFFDDPTHLYQDLLCDDASTYMKQLFK
ncbi:unnamed protein product [Rotaria socialis]|uniref:Uncharacterized protein n=1 Tax=Rotaria socialis TaxID=392032 RepID=A0A817SZI5_9BILA|nr:unnamed protein product [Rotaria socialis]CAF4453105.1 unnamed protein product [Rotaria socialis]